jgi:rhamnosyltransferase
VDNGSPDGAQDPLGIISSYPEIVILRNGRNLGLPAALNIGMHWAQDNDFEMVVLFDQDSTVTDSFVEDILKTYREHPRREDVGIVAPLYVSRQTGGIMPMSPRLLKKGILVSTMTSGALIPIAIFKRFGGFVEQLFIDLLDYEYSLRLRSQGLIIVQSSNARLFHGPGFPTTRKLPGGLHITLQNHKAERVYYFMRNRVWITIRHGRSFPSIYFRNLIGQLYLVMTIVMFEQEGLKKLWYSLKGLKDGVLGNMGKTIDL